MPELPEIETITRKLRDRLDLRSVENITLRRKDLRYPMPVKLIQNLVGKKILHVRRRSKYVVIDLSENFSLIVHLGMSGRLFFTDKIAPLNKHDHVLFDFDSGLHLRLRDPRRFGMLDVCTTSELNQHKLFKDLGPEPLEKDFNAEAFFKITKKSLSPIKSVIMNAKHVVGVGNIYASEALFMAGIRPTRRSSTLSKNQVMALCASIKQVLTQSISDGGTTFRDYVDANGSPGLHQLSLKVYGQEGKNCSVCTSRIKSMVLGQRSTYYCPLCQK